MTCSSWMSTWAIRWVRRKSRSRNWLPTHLGEMFSRRPMGTRMSSISDPYPPCMRDDWGGRHDSTGMKLSGVASQFAMQNRSFAMRNWMWFAENCDAKRFWPLKNNVIWVQFPCLHECMHLQIVFQCAPCDQRSSLVRDFFLFVCIMSMHGALDSCYFPCMHIRMSFSWFSSAPFW